MSLLPVNNFLHTNEAELSGVLRWGSSRRCLEHATSGTPISHFGSTRITMIHDSPPHRIFKISELARLITSQLVSINRRDIVNLACACKYLEEPVLNTLLETQSSLCTLLRVLPEETWEYAYPALSKCVVRSLDFLLENLNT